METKFLISKCSLIPSEGSSLKQNYDIVRGNPIIDYYESVESPSIALTITFVDIDQVIGREGITGGEYVDVTVKIDGFDDFKIKSKKHKLMLNSVKNMVTETSKQFASLEFVSVESIINETARVNKKFTDNVSQTIFELLIGDKKGIKTSKKLDKDRAANRYSFVGNLKRPFDTIQWLCPKTQASKDSFGFLFYENFDGYHFKSIKSLLEQDAFEYKQADKNIGTNAIILHSNLNQTNDIGLNLRMGMYANRTLFIDLEEHTLKEVDYKVEELGLSDPPKIANELETYPTRLMLKASDVGVSQKGSEKKDKQPKTELDERKNKSYIRNNLLFSQSIKISTPLNPDLRVGQMIEIKLPFKKGDGDKETDSYGNDKTNDASGKYLISGLRQLIGGGKSESQLTLIRDVFSA